MKPLGLALLGVVFAGCTYDFNEFEESKAKTDAAAPSEDDGADAAVTSSNTLPNTAETNEDAATPDSAQNGTQVDGGHSSSSLADVVLPPLDGQDEHDAAADTADAEASLDAGCCAAAPCSADCEATRTECRVACQTNDCRRDCNLAAKACVTACAF